VNDSRISVFTSGWENQGKLHEGKIFKRSEIGREPKQTKWLEGLKDKIREDNLRSINTLVCLEYVI
jgi:hypothetical protein